MGDLHKYSQNTNLESDNYIIADHCYARPWNWRPETSFLRPTKTLFVNKPLPGTRKTSNPLISIQKPDDIIDIENEPTNAGTFYDIEKAKSLMDECQRYALHARPDSCDEDWEEKISKLVIPLYNIFHSSIFASGRCFY